jgi:lysophospholipase L1-like esterase
MNTTRGLVRRLAHGLGLAAVIVAWTGVVILADHESRNPVVFGRYSREYFAFLIASSALAAICTAALILLPRRMPNLATVRRRLPVGFLLLAISTAVSIGALEVGIRATDLFGSSFYSEVRRYMLDLVSDDDLVVRHQPGLRTVYQGVEVSINAHGLREREMGPARPNRPRLVMLGNSVTFGWGVEVEDTYGRQLEDVLSGHFGLDVETVNTGVAGYNTIQMLRYTERHGTALQPDALVLMFVENDVDPLGPTPEELASLGGYLKHPRLNLEFALGRSRVYSMARHLIPGLILRPKVAVSDPGWDTAMASMRELAAWSRERQVPLLVFFFRMLPSEKTDLLYAELRAVAAEEQFELVDVLPWYAGINPRDLTVSFVDAHPNGAGHRILAEGMAETMVANGMLARWLNGATHGDSGLASTIE